MLTPSIPHKALGSVALIVCVVAPLAYCASVLGVNPLALSTSVAVFGLPAAAVHAEPLEAPPKPTTMLPAALGIEIEALALVIGPEFDDVKASESVVWYTPVKKMPPAYTILSPWLAP
jgi:hypothetical protein